MPSHVIKHQVVLSAEQRADLERLTRPSSVGVARKRWATIASGSGSSGTGWAPPSSEPPGPMPACPRLSTARPRPT